MDNLKVVFLSGWIKARSINDNPSEWLMSWLDSAQKAEENNFELVVFKIPKDPNNIGLSFDGIRAVEQFLQQKYKEVNNG